jgi:hypothetical protein
MASAVIGDFQAPKEAVWISVMVRHSPEFPAFPSYRDYTLIKGQPEKHRPLSSSHIIN